MPLNDWFIRITRPYDEIKEWVEWIPCEKKVAVQHDADEDVNRTHVHVLVLGCPLQKLSVKTKLERILGSKPAASDWSFKEPEDENYRKVCVYLSKGKIEYSLMLGFEYDWAEIKAEWVEPTKTQSQLNRLCQIIKLDKMKVKEMMSRINLLLEEDKTPYGDPIDNYLAKIRQVFIIENKCVIGRYKVRDIVDTLMAIHEPAEWRQSLRSFCQIRT